MRTFMTRISVSKLSTTSQFDPYKVLNISRHASSKEVKSAYFKLAKLYHPDKSRPKDGLTTDDKFLQIARAYEIITKKGGNLGNTSVDSESSYRQTRRQAYKVYENMNDGSFYQGPFSTGPMYMSNGKLAGIILLVSTVGGISLTAFYVDRLSKLQKYREDTRFASSQEYDRVIQKSKKSSLEAEIKKLEKLAHGSSDE